MCSEKLSINSCLQYLKYYIKKTKKNPDKNHFPSKKKKNKKIKHTQNNAINKTKQKQKPLKQTKKKKKKQQKN